MSNMSDIEQQAALWVLRQEESSWSSADEDRLNNWLEQSDAHKVAFWRLEYGWRMADRIASIGSAPSFVRWEKGKDLWWSAFAAAASLLLVFTVFALQAPNFFYRPQPDVQTARFGTAIGGHKTVRLPDGSHVELNTKTAIRTVVGNNRRAVWLDQGEAYFDVAKDAEREFIVYAGPRTITVLGTKFSVRRKGSKVTVAVLEGRVRVDDSAAAPAAPTTTITDGDMAIAEGRSLVVAANSMETVQDRLAWRNGFLVFDGTTLADVASEFNRYNNKPLVIADPIAKTRIGGSFQAKNVEAFARLLEEAYGFHVEFDSDKISVSS